MDLSPFASPRAWSPFLRKLPTQLVIDFDNWLSLGEKVERRLQALLKDLFEMSIAGVAAGDPQHLRWRSKSFDQIREVAVLGHADDVGVSRGLKDLAVLRVSESDFFDRLTLAPKILRDPRSQGGRQLGVQPKPHGTTTA